MLMICICIHDKFMFSCRVCYHGRRKDFFQGGSHHWIFPSGAKGIFPEEETMVKFHFASSN